MPEGSAAAYDLSLRLTGARGPIDNIEVIYASPAVRDSLRRLSVATPIFQDAELTPRVRRGSAYSLPCSEPPNDVGPCWARKGCQTHCNTKYTIPWASDAASASPIASRRVFVMLHPDLQHPVRGK